MISEVHKLVLELAERLPRLAKYSSFDEVPPEEHAAWKAPIAPLPAYDLSIVETAVPGPHGPVPIRVYSPTSPAPAEGRPALIWMHGGAYCWGDLNMVEADQVARGVAAQGDAVVVSVDYRLCPTPDEFLSGQTNRLDSQGQPVAFPIPQDDVEAVFHAVLADPEKFGANPARVSVGGASAGAGLASTMTIRAQRAGTPVHRVFLMYPALLHEKLVPLPPDQFEEVNALPASLQFPPEFVDLIGKVTRGKNPPPDQDHSDFVPGGTQKVKLFSPTYIENGEYDPFRAGGELFAEELKAASVPVEVKLVKGVPHGHLDWEGLPAAEESIREIAKRL